MKTETKVALGLGALAFIGSIFFTTTVDGKPLDDVIVGRINPEHGVPIDLSFTTDKNRKNAIEVSGSVY